MAKKRPAARAAPGKKKAAVQEKAPNPFELKGSKRKFNVLGRRVKGDKKSLVQARSDAVDKVCLTRQAVCIGGCRTKARQLPAAAWASRCSDTAACVVMCRGRRRCS